MSAKVTEPIYETEVIEISELPKVKTVKDDALFLIVQDGRSKQAEFKHMNAAAVKAAAEYTKESLVPVTVAIGSLSAGIDDVKALHQADVKQLSAAISSSATLLTAHLSDKIICTAESLSADFDDKLQKEDSKIRTLQKFVDDQDLGSIRSQLIDINYNVKHVSADVAKTAENLASTAKTLKAQITTEVKASAAKTLEAGKSYTDSEVKAAKSTLESKIKSVSTELTSQIASLSGSMVRSDMKLSAALDTNVERLDSSFAALSNSISADIGTLSTAISACVADEAALSTQLYGEDGDVMQIASDLSTLDIKLYGLKIEELNESNEIVTTVISAGDIDYLSAEVSNLASAVNSLSIEVASLKTSLEQNMKTATVTEDVQTGSYKLKADSIELCKMNIKKAGYQPVAVTTVKVFDEHQVEQEEVLALNRYVVSDERAAVELKNELNIDVNVNVQLKVSYVKSK